MEKDRGQPGNVKSNFHGYYLPNCPLCRQLALLILYYMVRINHQSINHVISSHYKQSGWSATKVLAVAAVRWRHYFHEWWSRLSMMITQSHSRRSAVLCICNRENCFSALAQNSLHENSLDNDSSLSTKMSCMYMFLENLPVASSGHHLQDTSFCHERISDLDFAAWEGRRGCDKLSWSQQTGEYSR